MNGPNIFLGGCFHIPCPGKCTTELVRYIKEKEGSEGLYDPPICMDLNPSENRDRYHCGKQLRCIQRFWSNCIGLLYCQGGKKSMELKRKWKFHFVLIKNC